MQHRNLALVALFLVGCADAKVTSTNNDLSTAPDLTVDKAGFWMDCVSDGDCASEICLKDNSQSPTGHCTQPCTRECPDNFECQTTRLSNTDEKDVCVPAKDTFCSRCQTHRECGDSNDLCLEIGGERFCSIDCRGNPGVCPAGFTCTQLGQVAEWLGVEQCMPINNICCVDVDKDGRGKGAACITTDCNDNDPKIYDDATDICDGVDNDCKNGTDENPVNCKKATCEQGQFGYFEHAAEPCTSGACVTQPSHDCGLYTCSDGGSMGDHCAIACDAEDDKKCVPTAHCDSSVCYSDLPNGQVCNEDSDCQSSHCANGFCCDVGNCCAQPSDCPNVGANAAACDDGATCQGSKGAITCVSFRCGAQNGVPDDSACNSSVEANKCGFYKSIYCSGAMTQSPPACPTHCSTHADCDPEGFCEPTGKTCIGDLDNGQACGNDDQRCKSGHCANGFCCNSGDCCASESDCPASYHTAPVCTTPTACQGKQDVARCNDNQCATEANVDNDSACGGSVLANDCGPYLPIYCNGQPTQPPPTCPTSCSSHSQCDLNAYCNASLVCVPDEPNGKSCRSADECQSNHCQNGFCCATGDCCNTAGDCGGYASAPVCNSQMTCQGTRVDAVCNPDKQCKSQSVDDDSACAGLQSNDCGPYPPIFCSAMQTQPENQPALCSGSCVDDNGCDVSAHCTGAPGTCAPDQGQGGYCNGPSECAAGLYCVDHVCCNTACNGSCEACDLAGSVGTCSAVPNGQDPSGECPGVSCAGYYYGWDGDTCYKKADVSAAQASCNGARACRTAAQECSAQSARGPAATTCDNLCQDPTGGTCTGTAAGTCTNVDQGSATCGNGVCKASSPRCVNGHGNACVPNSGAASTETCNGLDDNCDGATDNGAFSDGREVNNDCGTYNTLPGVGSDQGQTVNTVTLFPSGDVDYFRIDANETDSSCGCGILSFDEDYDLTVTLTVPGGAGSYQLCADTGCGTVGNHCKTVFAGSSGSITFQLDGACPGSDSYSLWVRVSAGNAPGFSCSPYTLSYYFDAGLCR